MDEHCSLNHNHDHHEHNNGHCHEHNHNSKNLLIVLVLTALYMVAEFVGGYFTNSLALTADAGHMLGDVGALILSFFALWLSGKKASAEKTYGYFRAEIFAAFINGVALVFIALMIIYEAYFRIIMAQNIQAFAMIVIATGGLLVNIIGAVILHAGSKENLNIKGAFLHIIGDLLGSVGAIIAGLLIYFYHFNLADPIISIIIAGFVLYSSINLTNSAVHILMENAPSHLSVEEIREEILKFEDIQNVHDLHVWSITSKSISLSVHIVAENANCERILKEINCMLKSKFDIVHSTIQIEPPDFHEYDCPLNFH